MGCLTQVVLLPHLLTVLYLMKSVEGRHGGKINTTSTVAAGVYVMLESRPRVNMVLFF